MGQSLIGSATVRAQITQIEKYNQAVNTFRGKYGYLPGDIKDPDASSFGFKARGTNPGQGDGNGILVNGLGGWRYGWCQGEGEVLMFWVDLSTAGLIGDGLTLATSTAGVGTITVSSTPNLNAYYPVAKIGNGNFVYVWSGGVNGDTLGNNGQNYYGIEVINEIYNSYSLSSSTPRLSVGQAYSMDNKMDDGLPTSGNVMAMGLDGGNTAPRWLSGTATYLYGGPGPGTAASASSTTCYDNGGNASNPMQYSMTQSGGAGVNCALSFKFQ